MTIKQTVKGILRRLRLYHPTPPIHIHPPTPLQNCFDALVRLGFKPRCLVDVGANHGIGRAGLCATFRIWKL